MREKFIGFLNENGIRPATFARDNSLKYSTVDDLLKGRSSAEKISVDTAIKIANGMGTTVEELYKHDISKDSESLLLESFRNLNDEGQEKALDYIHDLASMDKYKKGCQPFSLEKDA